MAPRQHDAAHHRKGRTTVAKVKAHAERDPASFRRNVTTTDNFGNALADAAADRGADYFSLLPTRSSCEEGGSLGKGGIQSPHSARHY